MRQVMYDAKHACMKLIGIRLLPRMHGGLRGAGGAHPDVDVLAILPAEEVHRFCSGHDVGVLGSSEGGGGGACCASC